MLVSRESRLKMVLLSDRLMLQIAKYCFLFPVLFKSDWLWPSFTQKYHSKMEQTLAGAETCTTPSPANTTSASALVVVLVAVSPEEFTAAARARFASVLAELVNETSSAVSIEDVVNASSAGGKRLASNSSRASRVTARLPLSGPGCASATRNLAPSAISDRLTAASIPIAAPPTVTITGCPAPPEAAPAAAPLPTELRQKATGTTAVVAAVVASVVSGTVTAAAAGAIGVSISSSAAGAVGTASPGASIYQLITAVQFMNVYGAMIGGGKSGGGNGRRSDGGGAAELGGGGSEAASAGNATDGSAAAFRRRPAPRFP